jgi:hypothetical protein
MAMAVFSIGLRASCFLESKKHLAAISQMVNTDNEQALIYLEFQRAFNGNASG